MSEPKESGFLGDLVDHASADSIVIRQGDQTYTYGDLVETANQWLAILDPLVEDGEVVAVDFIESAFDHAAILLAVMAAGGVHISSRQREASWRRLSEIGGSWHAITRHSLSNGIGPSLRTVVDIDSRAVITRTTVENPHQIATPHTGGRILETSGSSGEPKWVYWTETDLIADRRDWTREVGLNDQDIVLNIHPLDFAHGVDVHLLATLCARASMVHLPGRFDPSQTLEALTNHRATYMSALPSHYEAIGSSPGDSTDLGAHLTKALTGGALLSAGAAQELFDRCGVALKRLYGATEAGIMCADLGTHVQTDPRLTPMPDVEMEIRSIPGIDFTNCRVGEPHFRRAHRATGYWADPERTVAAFSQEWYASGDAVYVNLDGTISVLGRVDDVWTDEKGNVRSASEYVDAVTLVDGVDEVVVFAPAISPRRIATVLCRLQRSTGRSTCVQDEVEAAVAGLGEVAQIYYMSDWPKTAVGKPNRQVLLAWAQAA